MQTQEKSWFDYNGEDRVVSSHELRSRLNVQKEDLVNARSNMPSLDAACDGFRDGELVVLSGPTKNGKTLFAQTLTNEFAKQQIFSLWFTYEVPARQFMSVFPSLPLIYMPMKLKAHDMNWVEERIHESYHKFNTRVIFIDHLHFLFDMARTKNASLEIGQVIRRLKTIAVQGNYCIFLLCHTTKGARENLSYESIRDSSIVSQESDTCLMIKRTPELGENTARVRVEFHRRTGVMERVVNLAKVNGYMREVSRDGE